MVARSEVDCENLRQLTDVHHRLRIRCSLASHPNKVRRLLAGQMTAARVGSPARSTHAHHRPTMSRSIRCSHVDDDFCSTVPVRSPATLAIHSLRPHHLSASSAPPSIPPPLLLLSPHDVVRLVVFGRILLCAGRAASVLTLVRAEAVEQTVRRDVLHRSCGRPCSARQHAGVSRADEGGRVEHLAGREDASTIRTIRSGRTSTHARSMDRQSCCME
jgi:hypothetical protein